MWEASELRTPTGAAQSTCRPWSKAAPTWRSCKWVGVATMRASRFLVVRSNSSIVSKQASAEISSDAAASERVRESGSAMATSLAFSRSAKPDARVVP